MKLVEGDDEAAETEPVRLEVDTPAEPSEPSVLVRFAAGDPDAFTELFEAHRSRVYGFLVYSGVDASQRDDLFQEIFFKVHRSSKRFDPSRPFEPWLFTIAVNVIRSRPRVPRAANHDTTEADNTDAVSTIDPGSLAVEDVIGNETAAWLISELNDLPHEQREAVVLCCIRGMDQTQAAESLGIPVNTIKTHVRRARIALAKRLAVRNATIEREVKR